MAYKIPGEGASELFRRRMARAAQEQEAQERRLHDEIVRKAAMRAEAEETRRWKERMQFDLYLTAGEILDRLIRQRDENVPAVPDGPWNELFCEAVRTIPEARRFLEDVSIGMMKEDADEKAMGPG